MHRPNTARRGNAAESPWDQAQTFVVHARILLERVERAVKDKNGSALWEAAKASQEYQGKLVHAGYVAARKQQDERRRA